jgi:ParB family chromosome partitioning protein
VEASLDSASVAAELPEEPSGVDASSSDGSSLTTELPEEPSVQASPGLEGGAVARRASSSDSWGPPPTTRAHVAPALLPLERVDDDPTFRIRPEGDLSLLATDIARLGQLSPIELRLRPPDRFQVVSGFRRVAALRFLQRERVLARLHTDLSDEDALLLALASAIHSTPARREDLEATSARWESQGLLFPAARDMLEKALAPEDPLAPETVDENGEAVREVDPDEMAADLTLRVAELNQELSLLSDAFGDLEGSKRRELLEQLRYASQLVSYLERL